MQSRVKDALNQVLGLVNLRIGTLTSERAEKGRLEALARNGRFDREVFPRIRQFETADTGWILNAIQRHSACLSRFCDRTRSAHFTFANEYFSSPDAEVAYALIRELKPSRIVEVGSGSSSWLMRQAISDGALATELVCIDPAPRRSVIGAAHRFLEQRVECLEDETIPSWLAPGDFLFIDSSHQVACGNDVIYLLLNVLPQLAEGVVVHLHDIFLPYDYPREWIVDSGWRWNEQYLVQALLEGSDSLEVLWPGHYLQRSSSGSSQPFVGPKDQRASSLWIRVRRRPCGSRERQSPE